MDNAAITEKLMSLADPEYRDFQSKLLPTVSADSFIGVRTPQLRAFAKQLSAQQDTAIFLNDLPHRYFDEDQLHVFIVSRITDFDECLRRAEQFLPCINNWATCDQFSPSVFTKHREELLPHIDRWLSSSRTYTARFAIVSLMRYYLDDPFDPSHLVKVCRAANGSEEYYVKMAAAWYFATALAKQYEQTLSFLRTAGLDPWTANKAVQKAVESRRLTAAQKETIKALRTRT